MTSMAVAERPRRRRADAVLLSPASARASPSGPAPSTCRASPCRRSSPTAPPIRSARLDELRAAIALVRAPTEFVEVTGARHDLGSKTLDVPALAVDAALRLAPREHAGRSRSRSCYLPEVTWPSGDPNQPQGGPPPPPPPGVPPPPPPGPPGLASAAGQPDAPGPYAQASRTGQAPPPPYPGMDPSAAPKKSRKGLIIALAVLGVFSSASSSRRPSSSAR